MILFILELLYFRIADKCNIIDKPNERSSHSTIVLRGGGILGVRLIYNLIVVIGPEGQETCVEYEEESRHRCVVPCAPVPRLYKGI